MKLSDYRRVADLVSTREYPLELKNKGRIEISINGAFQNREFVDVIDSSVRLELRYRIHELDQQLVDLGVDIAA